MPSSFAIRVAARKDDQAKRDHDHGDGDQAASSTGSPPVRPASSTVAVMAPGPAISGMASGKAAMLRTRSSSACFGGRDLALDAHAKHHFRGDGKQQQPAGDAEGGQRNAEVASSLSPISAAPARMAAAIRLARIATWRRAAAGMPWVIARKVGASPTGSSTITR